MKNFEDKPTKEYFKVFHFLHNKEYELNSEEGVRRYKIFKANVNLVKEHNKKLSSYKLRVNKFADLTPEEFKEKYLMKPEEKKSQTQEGLRFLGEQGYFDKYADSDDEKLFEQHQESILEESKLNAYTPIDWTSSFGDARDQSSCGSCWAFATAGVVESFRNRKSNQNLGYLSTQQLVDCDKKSYGCNGGNFSTAFTYIKNTGLVSESSYSYKAVKNTCSIPSGSVFQIIKAYTYCSNYSAYTTRYCSEDKVYANLALGASAVGIDGTALQLYDSGVFDATCSEDNHAVILMGYGVSEFGTEYFKIRNSWGTDWGESGYVRVARNDSNEHS